MIKECFYISGRGGSIHKGLGSFLLERSRSVTGVSLSSDFLRDSFEYQLRSIRAHFSRIERESIPVIANSYGAYLLLNCLIALPALQTKVLILSPVVGTLISQIGYFKPQQAGRIPDALSKGALPKPLQLDICVGGLDNQCDLTALETLAKLVGADRFLILDGQGHMLERHLVCEVVDRFLG
jgi:hypothetical protein